MNASESQKNEPVPQDYDPKLYRLRHSTAHILAHAVRELFENSPEVKFAGGPPIKEGFYYDFSLPRALVPADLEWLEGRMKELIAAGHSFTYEEIDPEQARSLFYTQPFKLELLDGLARGSLDDHGEVALAHSSLPISLYRHGDFVDLCRGPHLTSGLEIDPNAIKLLKIAGAYWRGDETRPMLQRIYGTAWHSEADLNAYLHRLSEAEKRDHRKIGKELDLFFFHPTAPGMPYWLPNGFTVLNELISWWRSIHTHQQYQEIASPLINSKKLWETSGHWEHYRDDMFVMELGQGEVYGVKPMNCPNAMVVFNQKPRSYRDLPLRLSDCDILHRHERSGTLHGLLRVQKFQQDDAHIFVPDELAVIEEEYRKIIALVEEFYRVFGLKYRFRLATRPKEFMGDLQSWERAESALKEVLRKATKDSFEIASGDGAFYGPKIDILIKDAIGRDWQMGTIQLDFQLPRRFDCTYIDRDGKKRHPAVIHRVIYGSLERFLGILLEHTAGKLPLWLCPIQARVIPIATRHESYASEICRQMQQENIRVEVDASAATLGHKMRNLHLERIPYGVVIGDKEVESRSLAVKQRGRQGSAVLTLYQLLQGLRQEIVLKKSYEEE